MQGLEVAPFSMPLEDPLTVWTLILDGPIGLGLNAP